MSGNELRGSFEFAPAGVFVMRSPLLPWQELEAWGQDLEAPGSNDAQLEGALVRDRAKLRERLRTALLRPEVREALFVASPALEGTLDLWMAEPESERGRGLELALARYYERMCGRATPFGLCAGFSTGTSGSRTRLVLPERAALRRHSRPDMHYLGAACAALQADPALWPLLNYLPNSSLYEAGGRLRYVESKFKEKRLSYLAVSAELTDYLGAVLQRAVAGESAGKLAESLADAEITLEEASAYIEELITSQILVPDLANPVTGPEPLTSLIEQLRHYGEPASASITKLELLRTELASMDQSPPGQPPARYRELADRIDIAGSKPDLATLFQVELVKPAREATLNQVALTEIARGVELLRHLDRGMASTDLTRFRDAFSARYETREVPLTEALDEECGIPFPVSELASEPPGENELPLHQPRPAGSYRENLDVWLLRKLSAALSAGAPEIRLEPREIEKLRPDKLEPLPDAFAVVATLAAASTEDLDQGRFQVLFGHGSGPSGAELLGRFCHADPRLHQQVVALLRAEEAFHPEAVFAEIVHVPEARLGNVLTRPVLRDYEIVYLGRSGAPPERQLPITDLLLRAEGSRLVLRSRRLGREVIPRMTNAHNFTLSSLPAYRFLCALAHQEERMLWWNWGSLQGAPFLPRVTCGRLVFARATWNLEKADLLRLNKPAAAGRFQAAQQLRVALHLPRWVVLWDADNGLPIDLDNCLSVENFIHLTHQREGAMLTELFPGPDQLILRGPEGGFVHELIVPFVRLPKAPPFAPDPPEVPPSRPQPEPHVPEGFEEVFTPGSEWLSAKVYCGPATADYLLREVLPPFLEQVKASGWVDRWFFIRYGDPDWHLRLRFHGRPGTLLGEVLPALQALLQPHVASGAVLGWQLDTYRRETRRYGGPEAVELAEALFQADSETVVAILRAASAGDAAEKDRWHLALPGVDQLLADLGLDLKARHQLLKQASQGHAGPHRLDAPWRHQLSLDFRRDRKLLERMLQIEPAQDEALATAIEALRHRSSAMGPVAERLKSLGDAGRLGEPISVLAGSYIHMHINRLLRSRQPERELVIYDALVRLYESMLARERATPILTR
jgi:thiopeptide-type bacteriocin biosynthesis protein